MKTIRTFSTDEVRGIVDALKIKSFADRREAIRELVATHRPKIEHDVPGSLDNYFEGVVDLSPICNTTEGIEVRSTFAGVRDAMSLPALVNILVYEETAQLAGDAIVSPETQSAGSKRSKTGYAFGQHFKFKGEDDALKDLEALPPGGASLLEKALAELSPSMLAAVAAFVAGDPDKALDGFSAMINATSNTEIQRSIQAARSSISALPDPGDFVHNMMVKYGDDDDVRKAVRLLGKAPTVAPTEPEPDDPVAGPLPAPTETMARVVDAVLETQGLPGINQILDMANGGAASRREASELKGKVEELQRELEKASRRASPSLVLPEIKVAAETGGEIPSGKVVTANAGGIFGIKHELLDFDTPMWEWDGQHPNVPAVDENYIFRPKELLDVLLGLIKNKPTYLHGHTGTGKTSLIEQVCARLNWPMARINFESHITRSDLLGRDVLVSKAGATVSRFEHGFIPTHMRGPFVTIYDEFDAIMPDTSYVMQRVLENDVLILLENGGEIIRPHPMHRIFATGNTTGQGDEHGLYQAPRPQSMALLDRFTKWIEVDYLDPSQRKALIQKAAPLLSKNDVEMVAQYVTEHMEAFKDRRLMLPLTPRGYMNLADTLQTMLGVYPDKKANEARKHAFRSTILSRATERDAAVLEGIVQRVMS